MHVGHLRSQSAALGAQFGAGAIGAVDPCVSVGAALFKASTPQSSATRRAATSSRLRPSQCIVGGGHFNQWRLRSRMSRCMPLLSENAGRARGPHGVPPGCGVGLGGHRPLARKRVLACVMSRPATGTLDKVGTGGVSLSHFIIEFPARADRTRLSRLTATSALGCRNAAAALGHTFLCMPLIFPCRAAPLRVFSLRGEKERARRSIQPRRSSAAASEEHTPNALPLSSGSCWCRFLLSGLTTDRVSRSVASVARRRLLGIAYYACLSLTALRHGRACRRDLVEFRGPRDAVSVVRSGRGNRHGD